MPSFRDTFVRLQRRLRQRQSTGPSPRPSPEMTTVPQPIEAPDGHQTLSESLERTHEEAFRQLIEQSRRRNSHIRHIEAEAARLWTEAVILESEIRESRRQARSRSVAASPWGNTVGSMVLHQILVEENMEQRRNQHRNASRRYPYSSIEWGNQHGGRSSTRGQSPEEGRRNHDVEFESSPTLTHIGEHVMRVFNDLSADERPAMAAWIVLMAAAQVRRELEREGELDELAGRQTN